MLGVMGRMVLEIAFVLVLFHVIWSLVMLKSPPELYDGLKRKPVLNDHDSLLEVGV